MREYVRVTGDIWQEQTTIDWEQRRYEIAKDILTAYYSNSDRLMRQEHHKDAQQMQWKLLMLLLKNYKKGGLNHENRRKSKRVCWL